MRHIGTLHLAASLVRCINCRRLIPEEQSRRTSVGWKCKDACSAYARSGAVEK